MLILVRCLCVEYLSRYCTMSFELTLFILHINQPAYFMERNIEYIYISRTTQRTNNGQVPACSQEPVDSILWRPQLVWRQHKFDRPIIDWIGLVHVQLCPWVFKAATATKIYCKLGRPWGIISTLKSASEKSQTMESENRYTSPKIDVF